MTDLLTLATRLRESIDNPHRAADQSEGFKALLVEASNALVANAKEPVATSLVRALRHLPAIPEVPTSRFERDVYKWWEGLAKPALERAKAKGFDFRGTANFEVMSWDDDLKMWVESIPEPYYWGLFPWIWKRLTGYRDSYGRKAQVMWPWEA